MQADPVDVAIYVARAKLAHVEDREWDMRRDMELVREIFRKVQAKTTLDYRPIGPIEGYDDFDVGRHVEMLHKAGYIEGIYNKETHGQPGVVRIYDLSWDGHEFAGALLTDEGTWQKMKSAFGPEKLATAPLKMIESVAIQAVTAWALSKMGLN